MAFDFDAVVERRGTDSSKWLKYAGRDVIPMWVADMDFAAPAPVLEALHRRVDHGVFGYAEAPASTVEAVVSALERDYAWNVEPEWIVWLPGLVTGLNVVCRAACEQGDAVFTATPIYPPFLSAPRLSDRILVTAPLSLNGSRWEWDLDAVEAAITERTRLFMLCNPHNPVGRAYTRSELEAIADIAERHDMVICSDEIHAGLVLDPRCRHLPIAQLDERIAARSITLMAPSKTWNIPGLGCAFAIVPYGGLRRRIEHTMRGIVPHVNVLGYAATEAAFRDGEPWRAALVEHLRGNAEHFVKHISDTPGLKTTPIEATYLGWIDARGLGLANVHAFFEAAGVGLSDGADFGAPGYVRLNFGCTRATLDEGLQRIRVACEQHMSAR